MPSEILIKIEILIFIISALYVFYYVFGKIYKTYFAVKKAIIKEDISTVKMALNKVDLSAKEQNYQKEKNTKKLTSDEVKQLSDILSRVRTKSTKGFYDEARALVVEGLAIDKFNRDLNIELANIYEKEGNFANAEFIYTDLLNITKGNSELEKKLAFVYYMQGKLEDAFVLYNKLYKKNTGDEEVINMLCEVTYDLKDWKQAVKFINEFLKSKPRDITKLSMKAVAYEELRDFKEAINAHKKILEMQPYNTFARDKIRELSVYIN